MRTRQPDGCSQIKGMSVTVRNRDRLHASVFAHPNQSVNHRFPWIDHVYSGRQKVRPVARDH